MPVSFLLTIFLWFLEESLQKICRVKNNAYLCSPIWKQYAEIAQLVEHNLAKVGVASSSLVFRSKEEITFE